MPAKHGDRESQVFNALMALWSPPDSKGSALVVGDRDGHLQRALLRAEQEVTPWCRWSHGPAQGQLWPPPGTCDYGLLRIPREKDALQLCLETIASRLAPASPLWVYGANDEGIKSVRKHLAPWFDEPFTVGSKFHSRVWTARRTDAEARSDLDAWLGVHAMQLPSGERTWHHLPGVFAKGSLDPATALLLKSLPPDLAPRTALDFACGGGVIGAELRARWPETAITGIDADALAVEVARRNEGYHTVAVSDAWHHVPRSRYDLIVSNPPIHRGRVEDHRVLTSLIARSGEYLTPGGHLWLVGQKRLRLREHLKGHFSRVHCEADDGRFQVWSARS